MLIVACCHKLASFICVVSNDGGTYIIYQLVMMAEYILDTNSDPNLVIVQWVSLPVYSHIAISP